jgi:CheY-like chemotaxis protein
VARVLGLIPDLLFGSRVKASLAGAGHRVELVASGDSVRERLLVAPAPSKPVAAEVAPRSAHPAKAPGDGDRAPGDGLPAVLVVDLTGPDLDGARLLRQLAAEGLLAHTRTLGFYAHVDAEAREKARRAGFDVVVPRSRMAREAVALVEQLLSWPA